MAAHADRYDGQRRRGVLAAYYSIPHHVFELGTAIVFALVGWSWLMSPAQTGKRSPVGMVENTVYPTVWSLGYLVALPLIAYGIARSARVRVAGLWLLGMALTMQFIAALSADHVEPRSFSYAIFALACVLRALLLVKLTPRR